MGRGRGRRRQGPAASRLAGLTMRIHLRKPAKRPAPRAPVDLAARVTERARLLRALPQFIDLTGELLGDPRPDQSALARRVDQQIGDLARAPLWAAMGRISAARPNPWLRTTYEDDHEDDHA